MPDIEELIVEDVPGTTWTTIRQVGSAQIVLTRSLPSYASDAYTRAWTGYVRAELDGTCPACEAVSSLPPGVKTAAPGSELLMGMFLEHHGWCLFSPEALSLLERDCAPGSVPTPPDLSDTAVEAIGQHMDRIRQDTEGRTS